MNLKKSLTTLAFGLSLASGVLGAAQVAPAAHAAASTHPAIIAVLGPVGPISTGPIVLRLRPAISVQSSNCLLTVTGSFFTPGGLVNVVVDSDGANYGAFKMVQTTADSTGHINVTFGDDHLGPQIDVRGVNVTTHTQSAFVYDLAFCAK